ncbi:MAG: DUF393 domain-containing protein [Candidatus Velthaea sp.]|jgi:predicted DCC family thiol-disulfide oxidoreductase YuxK
MTTDASAVLIFDADCGLCARFVGGDLVRAARIRAAGYQSIARDPAVVRTLHEHGLDVERCATAMVLVANGRVWVGARAFNALLARAGGWRALAARLLGCPLLFPFELFAYRIIAANRRRISGWIGAPVCLRSCHAPFDTQGES